MQVEFSWTSGSGEPVSGFSVLMVCACCKSCFVVCILQRRHETWGQVTSPVTFVWPNQCQKMFLIMRNITLLWQVTVDVKETITGTEKSLSAGTGEEIRDRGAEPRIGELWSVMSYSPWPVSVEQGCQNLHCLNKPEEIRASRSYEWQSSNHAATVYVGPENPHSRLWNSHRRCCTHGDVFFTICTIQLSELDTNTTPSQDTPPM